MPVLRAALAAYARTLRRMTQRARHSPWLSGLCVVTVIAQAAFGFHGAGAWYGAVAFPAANLAFVSVALAIVDGLGPAPVVPPLRVPRLQLAVVVVVVVIHCALLLHQAPDPRFADNALTLGLVRAARAIPRSETASNLVVCVALPAFLLVTVSWSIPDFGLRGFRWPPAVGIGALYLPLFLFGGVPTPAGAFSYLMVAALPEEFLYRALLQRRLSAQLRDPLVAVVIAAIVFGLMHLPIMTRTYGWPWGLFFCLGVNAFGGALLGYVYHRSQSLWLVVLVHFWAGLATGAAAE
jgi:membrane protease YdiL (CAAX protease family)